MHLARARINPLPQEGCLAGRLSSNRRIAWTGPADYDSRADCLKESNLRPADAAGLRVLFPPPSGEIDASEGRYV